MAVWGVHDATGGWHVGSATRNHEHKATQGDKICLRLLPNRFLEILWRQPLQFII